MLSWGVRMGLLAKLPSIEIPRRAKGQKLMKGRPITGEEFERMLAKVPDVVGEAAATSWTHYLNGLWHSGLRLAESLELHWDRDDKLCVDLSASGPCCGFRPRWRKVIRIDYCPSPRSLPSSCW